MAVQDEPLITSPEIAADVDELISLGSTECTESPAGDSPAAQHLDSAAAAEAEKRYLDAVEHYAASAAEYSRGNLHCKQIDAVISQGRALRKHGDFAEARKAYGRALDLAKDYAYLSAAAAVFNNLGVLEPEDGRFRVALDYLAAARALWRYLGMESEVAYAQLAAGSILFRYSRLEDAQRELVASIERFEEIGEGGRVPLAAAVTWLSRAQVANGELEVAQSTLERALELRHAIGDQEGVAVTLDARGRVLSDLGRWQEAEADFRQVLKLLPESSLRNQVNTQGNLAELYQRSGRHREALQLSEKALLVVETEGIKDDSLRTFLLFVQAKAYHSLGQSERAAALLERILNLDELRRSADSGDLLMHFFAARRSRLDFQIDLMIELERVVEALEIQEKGRARGLLDHLFWGPRDIHSRATPQQREREGQVRAELETTGRALERVLGTTASMSEDAGLLVLQDRLARGTFELERLEAEMRARVAGDRVVTTRIWDDLEGLIGEDDLLLNYWLGSERSILMAFNHQDGWLYFDTLPGRELMEHSAERLRRLIAKGSERNAEIEAEGLAESLLRPVSQQVARAKRLVIVPDGALAVLPFVYLRPTRDGPRLSSSHRVVSIPSLSVLAAIRNRSRVEHEEMAADVVVVADPVYALSDERLPGHLRRSEPMPDQWRRLPASATAAEAIRRLLPEDRRREFVGFEATRSNILEDGLSQARFIHFGVHAELHPQTPQLSFLALTAIDPNGERIPDKLRLQDLEQLDLTAELVVLAACKTALGEQVRGEGPLAFPRVLLYAGADSVLASLWDVGDLVTAHLMKALFERILDEGLAPADALHQAQRAMIEAGYPARAWAGFVLIGDWQP